MSGKLGKNLRSGHLSEDLGVLFFRNFCAVAQLRQEDDYGIDIISTILRKEKKIFYAEKSFFVQIKSASIEVISYTEEEIKWLRELDLPFFISTVDKKTQTIKLFTLNNAFNSIINKSINKIDLYLDENKFYPKVRPVKLNHVKCEIGPPIWQGVLSDFSKPEFYESIYSLTKTWVDIESKLIIARKFQRNENYNWKVWEKPIQKSTRTITQKEKVKEYLESIVPYAEMLYQTILLEQKKTYKIECLKYLLLWFEEYKIRTSIELEILDSIPLKIAE